MTEERLVNPTTSPYVGMRLYGTDPSGALGFGVVTRINQSQDGWTYVRWDSGQECIVDWDTIAQVFDTNQVRGLRASVDIRIHYQFEDDIEFICRVLDTMRVTYDVIGDPDS